MRNKNKKTKIVATLGPSINSKSKLKKILDEGVNVLRINFSHAIHKDVINTINLIRELNSTYHYNAAILADLKDLKLELVQ